MVYSYMIFGIEYLIGTFLLSKYQYFVSKKKFTRICILVILLIALITRVFCFNTIPGLDVDEAMGGVNAWSIGKYGIDYFNLLKHPIYLFAWGSGMNILYPLITVPFIKIFGLNLVVYRTPLIFISVASYFLFVAACSRSNLDNKKLMLVISIVFFSPFSIQTTRYAVESNLFPLLMIIVLSLLIFFLFNKKAYKRKIYLSLMTITIGVSTYSYSNNWIFLAVFTLSLFCFLLQTKQIKFKQFVLQLCILTIIVFPLFLFVYVNYFRLTSLHLLGLGIPKLASARSAFIFNKGNVFRAIGINIWNTFKMIVSGYDGVTKIAMPVWGAFYPFMFIFAFIGIVKTVVDHPTYLDKVMLIMLLSSLINIIIIEASWTHFNSMMLPVFYFEAIGADKVFSRTIELRWGSIVFFTMLLLFFGSYINHKDFFQNSEQNTPGELQQFIRNTNDRRSVFIISSNNINNTNSGALFVLPLFYTKINPYVFHHLTRGVKEQEFMSYNDYGKWHIRHADTMNHKFSLKKRSAYIVQNGIDTSHRPKSIRLARKGTYYSLYLSY